ncbi:MAG: YHYH protein [Opitutaceae bacterium]|nr:YHYH protein [Opitutaceae bacterium]
MKRASPRLLALLIGLTGSLHAHVIGDASHDASARLFAREFAPVRVALYRHAAADRLEGGGGGSHSPLLAMFGRFAPAVRVRTEGDVLLIESNGLPAHGMMVGITAWQQQVPLPQPYTGDNAWRIPLHPRPSSNPVSIKDRFLRGAIALAANGVPIFNPQNNRGEISAEIGELDQWGGHCGRADDYHYHAAPLHLQAVLGERLPIAYALDGYAIYGLNEPDGSAPQGLDAFNGHETPALGYHYHASLKYPYVNGGFRGVVVERDGQVDPQPRAQGVRPALTGLRGAKITAFEGTPGATPSKLTYTVNGNPASISYTAEAGRAWKFHFVAADGTVRDETYRAGGGGKGGGKKKDGGKRE